MKRIYVAGDRHDNARAAKQIAEAIERIGSIGLVEASNRKRPYKGQPWTTDGERGKTEVHGITLRDVRDCLILALNNTCPKKVDPPQSVQDLDLAHADLEALSQNLSCWIERYMGIYPNIGEVRFTDKSGRG